MALVREKIDRMAQTDLPVLIHGESGTGKDVIASLIHRHSPFGDGPFLKIHCPAISGSIESEPIAFARKALLGTNGAGSGSLVAMNRATLFLDEVSELNPALQAKLLHLLQNGKLFSSGGDSDSIDVRIIAATNRDLEQEVGLGRFRQDLFYRINVVNLSLLPLRERSADIAEIAQYFLQVFQDKFKCGARPLSGSLLGIMRRYHWPGNIRQIENLMKRYVVLGSSEESIASELMGTRDSALQLDVPLQGDMSLKKITREAIRGLESKIILRALQANHWNRKRAAKSLDISYRAFLYKLKNAGVEEPSTDVAYAAKD